MTRLWYYNKHVTIGPSRTIQKIRMNDYWPFLITSKNAKTSSRGGQYVQINCLKKKVCQQKEGSSKIMHRLSIECITVYLLIEDRLIGII